MAPTRVTDDYYAILGVPQSAEEALIRSRYKKLALVTHPDKNRSPNAKAEFQLVSSRELDTVIDRSMFVDSHVLLTALHQLNDAYSTLIDPFKRAAYDTNNYPFIRTRPQPTNSTSNNYTNAAATNDAIREYKQQLAQIDKSLAGLRARKQQLDSDLFEACRARNRAVASLDRIDQEAAKDAEIRKNKQAKTGWVPYILSFGLYSAGGGGLSQAEKEEFQRRETERNTGRIVKETERERYEKEVKRLEQEAEKVRREILLVNGRKWTVENSLREAEERVRARMREEEEERKRKQEAARQEDLRKARERMVRKMEEERIKKQEAEWRRVEEVIARERRRQQEEEQLRKAEQEKTKKGEEGRKPAKQQQQPHQTKTQQPRGQSNQQQTSQHNRRQQRDRGKPNKKTTSDSANTTNHKTNSPNDTTKSTTSKQAPSSSTQPPGSQTGWATPGCHHKKWWTFEKGAHPCSRCARVTTQFAFRCPSCGITACGPCRDSLKGKGKGAGDGAGW